MKKVETRLFKKYLKSIGLQYKRTKGSHEIWDYPEDSGKSLDRPVIFRGAKKEIPVFHIHTSLDTLEIKAKDFENAIKHL